ncbi:M23 family metallopeptidase [Candidatus Haliotispira prima]|uniref:M23 family metallopeptidase n=1 Tax=Candidatus Haliotispira prima TaxID=3034016 RepID=A0ABY8MJ27_9SPIO|nr:M23 family metallopeptidase [Candidatus Haliotispira prima]
MDKINYSKNAWESEDPSVSESCFAFLGDADGTESIKDRGGDINCSTGGNNGDHSFREGDREMSLDGVPAVGVPMVNGPETVHGLIPSRSARSKRLEPQNSAGARSSLLSLVLRFFLRPLPLATVVISILAVVSVFWFSGFTSYEPDEVSWTGADGEIISPDGISVSAGSSDLGDGQEGWENWKSGLTEEVGYLERNEALVVMLKRYGLTQEQGSDLVLSVRDELDLTKLRAEDPIQLFFRTPSESRSSAGRQLVGFRVGSREKTVDAYVYQGQLKNEVQYHELSEKVFSATVVVTRSLYQDGVDKGVPGGVLLEMFNRYSFDINFQSDIQRGTRYELVYTMVYNEKDEVVSSGDILYANITLANGRSFPIFAYTDLAGKSEFFNSKGRSVNKALLLIPVNGAYVSSNFGYRRDPVLGTWRLHRGTDYAAPAGTPIKAGGNGKIIRRGWSRVGYGYHIIIRHSNGYDTLYGHMSRFRSGYRVGSSVRQGYIIGYVGSTGKSTGPHVHYEVRRYDRPVSLKSLHLQASRDLVGMDRRLFENSVRALQTRFEDMLPDLQDIRLPVNLAQKEASRRKANGVGGTRQD